MGYELEVGIVYRHGDNNFIAINDRELIGFDNRRPIIVSPEKKPPFNKQASVEDLCREWGISVQELDAEVSNRYFSPNPLDREESDSDEAEFF